MWIRKTTGEKEEYQPEKIRRTCLRAGASLELTNQVIKAVTSRVRNGTSTRRILEMTLEQLGKKDSIVATKYNLKNAIFDLGPAGFAFELLVSEILKVHGYKTKIPEILYGECISHEVDVVASKGDKTYMIECKFHNKAGLYTRVKDVLYIQSRFLDLKDGHKAKTCPIKFTHAMLACNTRFSDDVTRYAKCKNIRLLSWKYPLNHGIRELLESKRLYPITVLSSGSKGIYGRLAKNGVMLCRNIVKLSIKDIQQKAGVNKAKAQKIYNEAKELIQ